jgi:hypothetical protein
MVFRLIDSLAMKLCSTAFIIFFCVYQLACVIAPDQSSEYKPDEGVVSWNGPSEQNDANAYVQQVQDFWTDERLGRARPKPMSVGANDDHNLKSCGSGDETNAELAVYLLLILIAFFL